MQKLQSMMDFILHFFYFLLGVCNDYGRQHTYNGVGVKNADALYIPISILPNQTK